MIKKLVLASGALFLAFVISSCCDQSYCPDRVRCDDRGRLQEETPYRWDTQEQTEPGKERQHRRW